MTQKTKNELPKVSRSSHFTTEKEGVSDVRRATPQFCVVGVKNLILLGWGLILGYPTILIPGLQSKDSNGTDSAEFVLSIEEISWIGSINLLCVPLGSLTSGLLMDLVGKRRMMQILNLPMLAAWGLFYFGKDISHIYIALCLSGASGGLLEAPLLIYIAETIEPRFRGMLTASGTATVLGGVCIQFIIASMLPWRSVAAISAIIPFLAFNAVFLVPESPYWLYAKGRIDEAHKSLQWLRGWVKSSVVDEEFGKIAYSVESIQAESKKTSTVEQKSVGSKLKPFTKRNFIYPFLLILVSFIFGHFSGMTPLQTYSIQILSSYKVPINEYYATIFLGAAQVIGCLIGMIFVRSAGKRRLVFASFIGCGICFLAVPTHSYYSNSSHHHNFNVDSNKIEMSIENLEQKVLNVMHALRDHAIHNDSMNGVVQTTEKETHLSILNGDSVIRNIDANILTKIIQLYEEHLLKMTKINEPKFKEFSQHAGVLIKLPALDNYSTSQVANWTAQSGIDAEKLFVLLNISKYIIRPFMVNDNDTILKQINKIEQDMWNTLTSNSIETPPHLPAIINELSTTLSTFAKSINIGAINSENETETTDGIDRWIPLIILLRGSMFAHCGAKLFPWMLIGEVYPMEVRSAAAGVSSAIGYLIGFASNKLFLTMVAALTLNGVFWFYSAVAFIACIILYFILPETENRTLEEVQAFFDKSKRDELKQIEMKTHESDNVQSRVDP